jgi:hypothetical protein
MANGNRRLPNAFDRGIPRRNRYLSGGSYDYGPPAAITEDFGELGRGLEKGFDEAMDLAMKAEERLDKYTKEAQESQDFENTGISDIDNATRNLAYAAKEQLFDRKNMIGQDVPYTARNGKIKTRKYTINDFNKFKNNLVNNSKIWSGQIDLVNKTLEEYEKNDQLSDVTKEAFLQSVGATVNKNLSYNINVDENGNFKLISSGTDINPYGGDEEEVQIISNYKQSAVNKIQEVNKFDAVADIEKFRKTYAERKKTFEIGGEKYRSDQVLADMGLFTRHITEQSKDFEPALEAYLDNFANDKQKVIDYASKMGVKFGMIEMKDGNPTGKRGYIDKKTGKFVEDTNRIFINEDGTLELGEDARKNARADFKKAVEGAFGKKVEENLTKFRKQTPSPVAPAPEYGLTITGNASQTFNTEKDPVSVFNNTTGRTTQKPFGFNDISFAGLSVNSMNAKQAREEYDTAFEANNKYPPAVNQSLFGLKKVVNEAGEVIEKKYNLGNFEADNSDLYKNGSVRSTGFGGKNGLPTTDEDEMRDNIEKGHIAMDSFGIGVDMTSADLSEAGITAVKNSAGSGRQLTGITGVAFTYERYENKEYEMPDNPEEASKPRELENHWPKRPIGVRLIGNTVQGVTKASGRADTFTQEGAQTSTNIADTDTTKETQQLPTDLIPDGEIPQLIKLMSKKTEGLQKMFAGYANQANISNTEAFYLTMKQLQQISVKKN